MTPASPPQGTGAAPAPDEAARPEHGRDARNRRWREENRAALDAHAAEVARDGLPLARYRSF